MQALVADTDEVMALNESDKAWIRETIRDSTKQHGWGALQRFFKEWSGFGSAIAILLFAATQWTAYVEFRTTANNRLGGIEARLTGIEGQLAKQKVVAQALAPVADFRQGLPELVSAISTMKQQKLSISSSVVADLQRKMLSTDEQAPDYWKAASELVELRPVNFGDLNLPGDLAKAVGGPIPNQGSCYDMPMDYHENYVALDKPTSYTMILPFHDCTIVLDDWQALDQSPQLRHAREVEAKHSIKHLWLAFALVRVKVVYRGMPIIRVAGLHMYGCTFDFEITAPPAPAGENLLLALLSSDPLKPDVLFDLPKDGV